MRHTFTILTALSSAGAIATAQPITYDFSGTLGDHFASFIDEPEINSSQSGGVLRFDTGNAVTLDDPADAYAHTTFTPSYTESWTASIEFDLPLVYDTNYTPHATNDKDIILGIVALFTDGGTTWNSVASSFEAYDPGSDFGPLERQYYADEVTDDIGGAENWLDAADDATGTLTVSFDATTKIMTASNGNGDILLAIDIDASGTDWGMSDTDTFQVGFYGAANRRAVLTSTPISVDNFAAEIIEPDVSYDFAGVLDDHFFQANDDAGIISSQSGGVLRFDTGGGIPLTPDPFDLYVHHTFMPTYAESWTATIEFEMPLVYNTNYSHSDVVEQIVGVSLITVFDNGPGQYNDFVIDFEFSDPIGDEHAPRRQYFSEVIYNDTDGPVAILPAPANETTGSLTLSFDAGTKVLTASNGNGDVVFSSDIDDPASDWGMTDSDTFMIGIGGWTEERAMPASDPLTLDNFSGSIIETGVSYDFAGVLGDNFDVFFDEPGVDSAQVGGELVFDTNDVVTAADSTDAYAHTTFAPRFDQSWTASIDFGLPLVYDTNYVPNEAFEQFLGVGLAAIFNDGVNPISVVDTTIEVFHGTDPGSVSARELGVFWNYLDGENDLWQGTDGSGLVNGTLTLTFDATTKVITATSGAVTIGSYDLDAPGTDWGMTDSDTFGVGIFGGAENRAILVSDPLTLDNFTASVIADPAEPTCLPDTNGDGFLDLGDIGNFVQQFLAGDLAADFNGDGFLDTGDIGTFIQLFLAGC